MAWVREIEKLACLAGQGAWHALQTVNRFVPPAPSFRPRWADAPIPRGGERSYAPRGWPRETDSLCPRCVPEIRDAIERGELDWRAAVEARSGEIRARILERDGMIVMEKSCPKHGRFDEVLSIDPAFHARMEQLAPARDVTITSDDLHDHGSSTLRYGRGGVLSVDLTNRCNMMCSTCFMDANHAGHVFELELPEIKRILDDALRVRPRRQLSVQFAGGEPTLSPHFVEAVRYARDVGYFCVQAATNGVRFALEPGFAKQCKEAGLRLAYLQFDGVTNSAHAQRNVANLYEVKRRAIEELGAAGISVVLVVTAMRGVNDDQVGPIVQFAVDNADKVTVVSFQPVSFTGRNEGISDEERRAKRYTLSHLVHDVQAQTGWTDPLRDWFPLSALAPFGDVVDLLDGPNHDWGQLKCACHPHCGTGTILLVNKRTHQMVPLTELLDLEGLLADLQRIFDAGRPGPWGRAQYLAALLRHYRPERAPAGFDLLTAVKQFWSQTGAAHTGERDATAFEWRVLFIAAMHFQDLYNYDFRRTEMCIIPHGTPQGEVSFCAWNSGFGWRQIVEPQHSRGTAAEWYAEHGRHAIYSGGRSIELPADSVPGTVRDHPLAEREQACGGCAHAGLAGRCPSMPEPLAAAEPQAPAKPAKPAKPVKPVKHGARVA